MIGVNSKKKAALVIGTNYPGSSCQLSGCVNDANNMTLFLNTHCGYQMQDIHLLTDDGQPANMKNILAGFDWLVEKATTGCTELWLSYSGHGSYVDDQNGDEDDGRDEALCPCDCDTTGFIIDDDIYERLVAKLPAGVTLFAVFDCCHSGSMLDLPIMFTTSGRVTSNNHRVAANIVSISGCKDDQTSADAYISGKYAGALTWSFLEAIKEHNYSVNISGLVDTIRKLLKGKYDQLPMLALSHDELHDSVFMGNEINTVHGAVINNDNGTTTHAITFDLTADMHPRESTWNVWVEETKRWLFAVDSAFTQRYQHITMTVNLRPGKYQLVIRDSYGDGGVTAQVMDGNYNLVNETKAKGKLAEYPFTVLK